MADEKIINEEILDDEELEVVAGGTRRETRNDADRLRDLGFLSEGSASKADIQAALARVRAKTGLHVGFELNNDESNHYHINHQRKSRKEFWSQIYSALGKRY